MDERDDKPTVTIDRERLLALLDQTARDSRAPHVRTVPRQQLRARGSMPVVPVPGPPEPTDDGPDDAQGAEPAPQIPPLLIWAMILIFVVLFVGVIRIS